MPITPSPAVLRACDVLEHLAAQPRAAFSVSELARELGMARATCDAVLLALADRGFVDRREPDLRYVLGPAGIAVGEAARAAGTLLTHVAPLADALAAQTGTCVALAGRDRGETRVERVFDHGPAFGVRTRVGESVPLVPPFGAVFLAWDPEPLVEQWLDRAPSPLDDVERRRYRAALDAVRARGYSIGVASVRPDLLQILDELVDSPQSERALRERDDVLREITHSEYLPTSVEGDAPRRVEQISVPVFDGTGRVALAMMLLCPTYELTPTEVGLLGDRMLAAARAATERIGGRIPAPGARADGAVA